MMENKQIALGFRNTCRNAAFNIEKLKNTLEIEKKTKQNKTKFCKVIHSLMQVL